MFKDVDNEEIREAASASGFRRILAQARRRPRLPLDFVNALTEAGYLATLIPEEYGGAGLALSAAAAAGAAQHRLCS
ncbi:acyl-CoA dehydrogenase family protein [Mesorhizobium sp. B2-4-6]|uniref:acyl-CoA dehydrogenase family protein n=1 Tax=Mesorhizobium sp. B2-4-6 TaxID=2589943 RepID=UPI00112E3E25|nr:acyl-CoA dehydrogenase family protein [Mesorhizobium sp. B2-4-6]TPL45931.1 acyl-CoA dehydrogenase family protein [Mesorhizobium sp. B2-4-6]